MLRRTIRRIGLLDRTAVFDQDDRLHDRIETTFAALSTESSRPAGPPCEELLARMTTAAET